MEVVAAPQSMHAIVGKGSFAISLHGREIVLYGLSIASPRREDRRADRAHSRAPGEELGFDVEHDLLPVVRFVAHAFVEADHPILGRSPDVNDPYSSAAMCALL